MSTLVSDVGPPDRPLEPWERFQLAVWREMRGEIGRRARRAV